MTPILSVGGDGTRSGYSRDAIPAKPLRRSERHASYSTEVPAAPPLIGPQAYLEEARQAKVYSLELRVRLGAGQQEVLRFEVLRAGSGERVVFYHQCLMELWGQRACGVGSQLLAKVSVQATRVAVPHTALQPRSRIGDRPRHAANHAS